MRNRPAASGSDKEPSRLLRLVLPFPGGAHAGEEGAKLRVFAQGGELKGLLEVLGILLSGVDGLLDIVEGGGVVTAAGPYARERRARGGVAGAVETARAPWSPRRALRLAGAESAGE